MIFRIASVLVLVVVSAPVYAQISPGELARPHEELDGNRNCTRCHGDKAEEMNDNCLACHREIRQLLDQKRGFHFNVRRQECSSCHPDHGGRDFELVAWESGSPEAFNHARSGWSLTGKHLEKSCRSCHTPKYQTDPVMKTANRKHPEDSWLGLKTECTACHKDPHTGAFGAVCTDCHNTRSFSEIDRNTFKHERTRYPLLGRHAAVPCASCHDPVKAWGKKPAFERCTSCHADAHAGTATLSGKQVDCAACHSEQGWKPATFTVAAHQKSSYPLEGKHKSVACRACHTTSANKSVVGTAGIDLRPRHDACLSCHEQSHGKQLLSRPGGGACEGCHSTKGWRPSSFAVDDHGETDFPLAGKHAETECRSCHGPDRAGLPPLPGPEITGPAKVMLALRESACRDCHFDPHGGRYTAGATQQFGKCNACHDDKSFHRTTVDVSVHARFTFPLRGAHGATPCVLCHSELNHKPAASTLIAAKTPVPSLPFSGNRSACRDCHENPHGEQFGPGAPCERCHGEDTFQPANRFDHDRDSRFPLQGAHEKTPCERCHPSRMEEGKKQVLYKPLATTCLSCHGGIIR